MATVGWFTWAPELKDEKPTSAGNGHWTRFLLNEIRSAGHKIMWLADENAPKGTKTGSMFDCDVVFINWRWSMPNYPERDALYMKQMRMIRMLASSKVKIVVHDQDHKISPYDLTELANMGAILTAPELRPRPGFRTLHFPNPFKKLADFDGVRETPLVYIGNSYERYYQALRLIRPFAQYYKTIMHGNWVEHSPYGSDRPDPDRVREDFANVEFCGRLEQKYVVDTLSRAMTTVHLFKPSYGPSGFVTLRWAEAAAAGIPAFVPEEFHLPHKWRGAFEPTGIVVTNGRDMAKVYSTAKEEKWQKIVLAQRRFVQENMRTEPWIDLIEAVVK